MVDTTKHKVRNSGTARDGIRMPDGTIVWMAPGQERDLDLTEEQVRRYGRAGSPLVLDDGQDSAPTLGALNAGQAPAVPGDPDLQARYDELLSSNQRLQNELTSATASVEEMRLSMDQMQQRINELESQNQTDVPEDLAGILEAKHRGAGSYSVLRNGETSVMDGLSKDQADAFNKMSETERVAWLVEKRGE